MNIENTGGLLILAILGLLTFIITLVTLIVSRKYLKTKISLSLEVTRDPHKPEDDD